METSDVLHDFDTVIVCAPDVQGRLFGRRMSSQQFVEVSAGSGVSFSRCVYSWDIEQSPELMASGALEYASVTQGMGDFELRPDPVTLRPATWLHRTAICLAHSIEGSGEPTPVSPREILLAEVEAWSTAGLRASIGTELEFTLLRESPQECADRAFEQLTPTTAKPADYLLTEGDEFEPMFTELRSVLDSSGLRMEASQIEWGPGQWEITLQHGDPVGMADRHAIFKWATKSVSAKHGYTASFMAKPYDSWPGNSCHVHVSVWDDAGDNLLWNVDAHDYSSRMLHAIGGLMEWTPSLMAFYAPTINSYTRTRAQDAAGWGLTWARDHRFVSARLLGHSPSSARIEFRLPGADTNPYLTIAGVLRAIRSGLDNQSDPGPETVGNPLEGEPVGVPRDLGSAAQAFRNSPLVASWLGQAVADHFATLMDHEWNQYLNAVTGWERSRYLLGI